MAVQYDKGVQAVSHRRAKTGECTQPGQKGLNRFSKWFAEVTLAQNLVRAGRFRTGDFFIVRDESHKAEFFDRKEHINIRSTTHAAPFMAIQRTHPGVRGGGIAPADDIMGEKTRIMVVPNIRRGRRRWKISSRTRPQIGGKAAGMAGADRRSRAIRSKQILKAPRKSAFAQSQPELLPGSDFLA